MRGNPQTISLIRPKNAKEALAAYSKNPQAIPLAGGTDFMVAWNAGHFAGATILDLLGLKEWKRIGILKDRVRIGALTTHAEIQKHSVIQKHFPLLVQACATVGAAQIQNRGTLGGNIANASPAGDTFPALAVYEAVIHAVSKKGRRQIPFLKIFAGVKKTTLEPGELIEAVELPFFKAKPSRQFFRKVGTRAAQAISKTVGAGLLWLNRKGMVEAARISFGSVAPTVRRAYAVERVLEGRRLDSELAEQCARALEHDVAPIDDIRSTAQYRLEVSRNLLRAFLK